MTANVDKLVDGLRSALQANERLREQNRALTLRAEDPVVVVGMACRFPGGVASPQDLWRLVAAGEDGISGFPADRGWDLRGCDVRGGGFLQDAAWFDPGFFGISPREALAMDPQQRLLLETGWEAFEDAGIDPRTLRGSRTGVFVGTNGQDHGIVRSTAAEGKGYGVGDYTASVLSGRLSYFFGLEGPAMTVDTACSSSLVAMHLAARSLRAGECSLALAAGVTVMSTPGTFVEFSRQGALSPDGRCRAFGAAADGFGLAEGAGVALLERLSDARRLGHEVLAVVSGSAVNQDGASHGLTAPNGPSQERVIRAALADAGAVPADVDIVEAHGTGTVLGDPIEAQALISVYGRDRAVDQPLWLGSVKSNLGHTQAAAGIAGVIKMVMALRHRRLPATLHAQELSPHVDWTAGEVRPLTESVPWRALPGRARRAGVSSFGVSGTNAHLILTEPPAAEEVGAEVGAPVSVVPWVLSARSAGALRAQAGRLLAAWDGDGVADVGWSLASARGVLEHRAVVVGRDPEELGAGLACLAGEGSDANVVVGGGVVSSSGVVFVFSGQGGQWPGMAVELLDACPVFAQSLRECDEVLSEFVDWSVEDVLRDAPALGQVDVVQPVLFAVLVSLARLWESWGVVPAAVVGHSQGEIAAAHIAGALSLQDAARVVALRSQALMALSGKGSMASVALSLEQVHEQLELFGAGLSVAADNGPSSVVVSGEPETVERWVLWCHDRGVHARLIDVDYASHCELVEPVRQRLLAELASVTPRASKIAFYSTVTGAPADTTTLDVDYWYRNLRDTVQLRPVIEDLAARGHRVFAEIGPHPILTGALQDALDQHADATATGTLRRGEGLHRFLTNTAELFAAGVDVDWKVLFAGTGARRVPLPLYAFQRDHYWLRPTASVAGGTGHPMLGAEVELADGGVVHTGQVSVREHPWLADHRVGDTIVLSGTTFLGLVLRAGAGTGHEQLQELVLRTPLPLSEHRTVEIQVRVQPPSADGQRAVGVYSRPTEGEQTWSCHATGSLSAVDEQELVGTVELQDVWPPAGCVPVDVSAAYELLAQAGLPYGESFRGLRKVWRRDAELFAEVEAPQSVEQAGPFGVHPALLDSALHPLIFISGYRADDRGSVWLPFSWNGVRAFDAAPAADGLRVRLVPVSSGTIEVAAADLGGRLVLTARSLVVRHQSIGSVVEAAAIANVSFAQQHPLRLDWLPAASTFAADVPLSPLPRMGSGDDNGAGVVALPVWELESATGAAGPAGELTVPVLKAVREFLNLERYADTRLAVLTRRAVATGPGEVPDPAKAAVWGLIRSAQTENPGRILLLDTAAAEPDAVSRAVHAGFAQDENQLALRGDTVYLPRLARCDDDDSLPIPDEPWRLRCAGTGTLADLRIAPVGPDALADGQVRISVAAAGLNFRDVLGALGVYPGEVTLGQEAAGIVTEVGPGVPGFAVGDEVLGIFPNSFGSVAVADHRMIVAKPAGWSFAQAAAVPVAYLTAYFGLRDLGRIEAGDSVLVHAAAGGVGTAARQLAEVWGARVLATAAPAKWDVLFADGLGDEQVASSRTLDFEQKFRAATGGRGVDVVLNALVGDFTDASLRLLAPSGRFVEMGKADIRDQDVVAAEHPDITYRAFDLAEAGPERIHRMLTEIVALFAAGKLSFPPISVRPIQAAREAFRDMSQARHRGKIVFTVPPASVFGAGAVLVTGGTGTLGALVARHLVACHEVRDLVLISRGGANSTGAEELVEELEAGGARVRVSACDVSDRDALADLLDTVERDGPVIGVVHAAGALADTPVSSLTEAGLREVLAAKAGGAWNLHELLGDRVSAFVLFSSAAGVFGSGGQGNYAAANAFLDALAQSRAVRGMAGVSMSWGLWAQRSAMTGHLGERGLRRLHDGGLDPLSAAQGLRLFDQALTAGAPHLVMAALDIARMRSVPALLRELAPTTTRVPTEGFLGRLRTAEVARREQLVVDLVCTHAAAVLGHRDRHTLTTVLGTHGTFRDLGMDSLTGIELRNRLRGVTGLSLPATMVFDFPTPAVLAVHLLSRLFPDEPESAPVVVNEPPDADVAQDPVVVVGMACRFPGGVSSPEDLWRVVASEVDVISGFPADRGWDLENLFDPDPDRTGTFYARGGGFLHEAAKFDAGFFGISPREALAMDPQQRLLLETSWEAFESAGMNPRSLRGSRTGVFVGLAYHDYAARAADQVPAEVEGIWGTGNAGSVASGRLSYVYGLEGPAMTVDTACSSSLVAMHVAAQSLRGGECSLALVAGATVMSTPGTFIEFSRQRGLAPDGRCKAFGAGADGTGWSEGVGVLLLERLSDARRLGHDVLAVVSGSAVNQDGASNGLTAPNGPSQERVIRAALAAAGTRPDQVDVVEAHGTGTVLGDPIEAQALISVYGKDRAADQPLWLGSVKSNIGHTQAAAGVAGVIKMVLAMRHGVLPATLHAAEPSPHVDWSAGRVRLLAGSVGWPATPGHVRRAAVSSFGVSGTNAHLVLAEPPVVEPSDTERSSGLEPGIVPWVLSGHTPDGLRAQAARLLAAWDGGALGDGETVAAALDVGWSLVSSRGVLEHRAVVLGRDTAELKAGVERLAEQGTADVVSGGLGLLFAGQGTWRPGVGRELYETYPVFATAFDEVCARVNAIRCDGPGLAAVVFADEGDPLAGLAQRTEWAQPALLALEVALFRLTWHWGVRPDFVAGHSLGEIIAAHVAGVLSLDDACVLVEARARLMQALPVGGAMLAVNASPAEIARWPGAAELSVAAVNGKSSVVLSGDREAADAAMSYWEGQGRRVGRLKVSHAFHSALMEPMLEDFAKVVAGLELRAPVIPLVSNVTGRIATAAEVCCPEYWVRQVRETVRFADCLDTLREAGVTRFLELGPDATLTSMVTEHVAVDHADEGPDPCLEAALRPGRPEPRSVLDALARLFTAGVDVDWSSLFAGTGARRVPLPAYAFQRDHYWLASPAPVTTSTGDDAELWSVLERGDVEAIVSVLDERTESRDQARSSLLAALPLLKAWRERHTAKNLLDSWRYRVTWEPVSLNSGGHLTGRWVVAGGNSDEQWLDALLTALGSTAARVDADQLGAVPAGIAGVIWPVRADSDDAAGVVAAAELAEFLRSPAFLDGEFPVYCLTRGAVSTARTETVGSPGQSALWGLSRVAALEFPGRWGCVIDLPDVLDPHVASLLRACLAEQHGEDQVAVRPGGVFGRRLIKARLPERAAEVRKPRGTVLITGGTGALGTQVARSAAARGAEHIVLVSRRGADAPGATALARELEQAGTKVTMKACDVTDRESLRKVLAEIPQELPLTSIVHTAGARDGDSTIADLSRARMDRLMRIKAVSAWHLHELARDLPLDEFVLFSSVAATWGSRAQPGYAAANAFLDGLAEHRRGLGLAGTSVAWGPWAGDGMAADPEAIEHLRRRGVRPMSPELAVQEMWRAAEAPWGVVAVADVDWDLFLPSFTAQRRSPLFERLQPEGHTTGAPDTAEEPGAAELLRRLGDLTAGERLRALESLVCRETAVVLGHAGPGDVRPDRTFRAQGFDSLMALTLRNRLRAEAGVELPAALVFDFPTPREVAAHLVARFGDGPSGPPAPRRPDRFEEAVGTVSVEALLDLIDAELFDSE